jgi:uncharacterized delta-60 repeat protein
MKINLKSLVQIMIILGMCLSLLGSFNLPVQAQSALDGFNPNANDSVRALFVQEDGKILVGGDFTQIGGSAQNRIARLNPDGQLDTSFNASVNEISVNSLAVQPDGEILIGGLFSQVDGQQHANIARLHNSGELDTSFTSQTDLHIYAIVIQPDGKILIGGAFSEVNGESRNRIARLNPDGSLDEGFNPNVIAENDPNNEYYGGMVNAMVLQSDGKILVGGLFTQIGGQHCKDIARLNPDGTLDTIFNPDLQSIDPEYPSSVRALAVQADGKILLGGKFDTVNGALNKNLARLNHDGSLDISFAPNPNNLVDTVMVEPDGKILLGGAFSQVESITRNYIARLNFDGSLDEDFNPNADNPVVALALQSDGKILAGGFFTHIGDVERSRIARLYPDGGLDADLNPGADAAVMALALQADGKILLGGYFTQVGGMGRNHLARLNPDGSLDIDFNPDVDGVVYAIAVQPDGKVIIGGNFTHVNGVERSNIARLSCEGSLEETFNPGAGGNVFALAIQPDRKILVGGGFTLLGGETRNHIGRLESDGSLDDTFAPNIDSTVYTLALHLENKILVGGYFTTVEGQTRNHIARLNANGSLDTGFAPDADGPVYALAVQADHKVLIGGNFYLVDGIQHSYIARLNQEGDLDDAFNPGIASGDVYSIALQSDGKILVGGFFLSVGGQSRKRIARLAQNGDLDQDFNPGADNTVRAIALQPDGKIVMGGAFTEVDGQPRDHIARLSNNIPAQQAFSVDPLGREITWQLSGSSPELWRVIFEYSYNGIDFYSLGEGTRTLDGWHLDGQRLPKEQDLWVRAKGFYSTGFYNSSGSVLESTYYVFAPVVTYYAKPQSAGTSDCLSWEDACDLVEALAVSSSGDEIWVAEGVHYPGSAPENWFNLFSGVAVLGGFIGVETASVERDWQAHPTILSGDVGRDDDNADGNFIAETTDDIRGENAYHVVTAINGISNTTRLDGFIITGGMANHQGDNCGGGMYNDYMSGPTLTNLVFIGNKGEIGGGICNDLYCGPELTNVSFINNQAVNGGGMYNYYMSGPKLTNVTFSNNAATNAGGGIGNFSTSTPKLKNVIMWGNDAPTGMEIYNGSFCDTWIFFSDVQGCGGSSAWNVACGTDYGGNIDADPLFIDAANGDLRLGLHSPAIDAGDNSAVPAEILTDLAGNPRFVDIPLVLDTGSGTSPIVDIGAYECQYFGIHLPLMLK